MKKKAVAEFQPFAEALKIDKNATIRQMVELFVDHPQRHHLCILDENESLLGLIDRKRLFKAIFSHHVSGSSRIGQLFTLLTSENAGDLMLQEVISISPDESIGKVIETMIRENIFELPVVDANNRVLGFLSSELILRTWLQEAQDD